MTAKSRYLGSINRGQQLDFAKDPSAYDLSNALDDPPPPPPNPPNKRGSKPRIANSTTTSRTSAMSSSNSDPVRDDVEEDNVEPPSSISVASGSMSINYDDILNEGKSTKSDESSAFSVPILSVSTAESSSKASKKQPKRTDGKSVKSGDDSYSSLGFSQLDDSVMSPPPPPPGAPPNSKNKNSARSGRPGSASSKSRGSSKKAEYRSSEFSNVDFDLSSLKSGASNSKSNSLKSTSVSKQSEKSKSVRSKDASHRSSSSRSGGEGSKSRTSKTSKSSSKRAPAISEDIFSEEESVETEVLRYGEVSKSKDVEEMMSIPEESLKSENSKSTSKKGSVSTVDSNSTGADSQKKMSVAEKRRRKALANSGLTPDVDTLSRSISRESGRSKATEVTSNVKRNVEEDLYNAAKKQLERVPQDKADYDDPPLVLYDSDDNQSDGEGQTKALNKKKKSGAFSKMRNLLRGGNKSPCKDRNNTDKSNKKNSPFRKKSSSEKKSKEPEEPPKRYGEIDMKKSGKAVQSRKTKETEDAPQAKEVSKAEKQTKEGVNESIPFKKIDSDLSFEPPVRLLQKLESDLSLAPDKIDSDNNNSSVSQQSRSESKSKSEAEQHLNDLENSTKGESKTTQSSQRKAEQSSRASYDQDRNHMNNIDVEDDRSQDEVSEMTNPTFVSNHRLDPPEESRSVTSRRSMRSYRSSSENGNKPQSARSSDTPLISNQLHAVNERNEDDVHDDINDNNIDNNSLEKLPEKYENEIEKTEDEDLEEFFDGLNWGNEGQEHNEFFLTTTSSNEQSTASRDPFEEPFYPDVTSVVSKESEKEESLQMTLSEEPSEKDESKGEKVKDVDTPEEEYHDDDQLGDRVTVKETAPRNNYVEENTLSISQQKIDVKKVKEDRRRRSLSPRKRNNISERSVASAPAVQAYHKSPGIKVNSRDLLKNDNEFLKEIKREEQARSPSFAKTPSFIAKRQNRDRKEENIRAKLEQERQAALQNAALQNARRRMESVSRAAEIGRRRENLIESSSERNSSRLSAYGRSRSPQKQRNETDHRSSAISSSKPRSGSPRKQQVKINTVGSLRGKQGSSGIPERSNSIRSQNSMRVVEPSGGNGPPMRVARSFSHEQDEEQKNSLVSRKSFKAPEVFNKKDSKRIKPFKAPEAFKNPELAPSVSKDISDPIQRAGLRLLSAAAVPIQTEIRRYLAKREAEDRLWAIIVIQSYFRRWRAELMMYKYLYCATRIQAAFRGWLVRDTLDHKHYCAIQIQRICRGYLATMRVYEALYNITVVQSIARRNAAIKAAEKRYKSIVKIQAVYRGHLCRKQLNYQHEKATVIQTAWRCFSAQLNYQFDIVDIIIVQSIARKRACQKRYAAMLLKRHTKAAIVIQKYWRSYDCTMNYLHSIADILIVQSVVRRWIAMRFVPKYRAEIHNKMATRIQTAARGWVARHKHNKYKAAKKIQKTWRGFKVYMEYIFTVADIVLVQKTVRVWLAKRYFEQLKIRRGQERLENAAVTIQKVWRGYQAHMNMLFTLVHIIIAQSVIRRRIAIVKCKPMLMEHRAAITLQCLWRVRLAKNECARQSAARKIQAAARGWFAYSAYTAYLAARRIQSWYRCQATRRGYLYYISARKIQTIWRGYDARKLADEERWIREYAATMIQKNWRMSSQHAKYKQFIKEKKAATKIQSQWRCFWEYSHFIILRYEVIRIQAAVRGYQTRQRMKLENEKAIVIQSVARMMLAKRYCHMERLFGAVMHSAQISLCYKNAAKKLQKGFRDMHYTLKEKKAALVIERFFIWVRNEVEKEIARREKVKLMKKQKLRSKRTFQQDNILDNVWDGTVEPSVAEPRKSVHVSPTRSRISAPLSPTKSRVTAQEFTERARVLSPSRSKASKQNTTMHLSPRRSLKAPSSPFMSKKIAHDLDNKPEKSDSVSDPDLVALDFDDESSEVSGLTTPSLTPRYLKNKRKQANSILDDQLDKAWAESKKQWSQQKDSMSDRKIERPIEEEKEEESSKENSVSPPRSRLQMREPGSPPNRRPMRFNQGSLSRSPSKSTSMRSEMLRLTKGGYGN